MTPIFVMGINKYIVLFDQEKKGEDVQLWEIYIIKRLFVMKPTLKVV